MRAGVTGQGCAEAVGVLNGEAERPRRVAGRALQAVLLAGRRHRRVVVPEAGLQEGDHLEPPRRGEVHVNVWRAASAFVEEALEQ